MPIITISRGSLAAGQTLAEHVAQQLGYCCVGSDALIAAAAKYGVPEPEISRVLETRPSFWERVTATRDWYTTIMRVAMCDLAQAEEGQLVYHGLAGQELLKGVSHLVKVRVIAPMEQRIRSSMDSQSVSADTARHRIDQVDQDRLRRMRHLFNIDWRDPELYDVVLNLGHMDLDSACGVVVGLAGRPEYQPTVRSEKMLADLTLSSRVMVALLEQFSAAGIEVYADNGVVRLDGQMHGLDEDLNALIRVVQDVPGVDRVYCDVKLQAIPYFTP